MKAYLNHKLALNGPNEIFKNLKLLGMKNTFKKVPENLRNVNEINSFFSGNFSNSFTPNPELLNHYYEKQPPHDKFSFSLVSPSEVEDILSNIKTNATGVDGISAHVLKISCPIILPYLTHIVNYSLECSVFPDLWNTTT